MKKISINHKLFTIHYSLFIIHYSLFTIHCHAKAWLRHPRGFQSACFYDFPVCFGTVAFGNSPCAGASFPISAFSLCNRLSTKAVRVRFHFIQVVGCRMQFYKLLTQIQPQCCFHFSVIEGHLHDRKAFPTDHPSDLVFVAFQRSGGDSDPFTVHIAIGGFDDILLVQHIRQKILLFPVNRAEGVTALQNDVFRNP